MPKNWLPSSWKAKNAKHIPNDLGSALGIHYVYKKTNIFIMPGVAIEMKNMMKHARAKNHILPLTRYGLMQITRERVRQQITIEENNFCGDCYKETFSLISDIESKIKFLAQDKKLKKITINTNPILHSFLTKGIFSYKLKWM